MINVCGVIVLRMHALVRERMQNVIVDVVVIDSVVGGVVEGVVSIEYVE